MRVSVDRLKSFSWRRLRGLMQRHHIDRGAALRVFSSRNIIFFYWRVCCLACLPAPFLFFKRWLHALFFLQKPNTQRKQQVERKKTEASKSAGRRAREYKNAFIRSKRRQRNKTNALFLFAGGRVACPPPPPGEKKTPRALLILLPPSSSSFDQSDPVPLLQLERQVHVAEVLEAKAAERLDLGLDLGLEHELKLGDPRRVGLDKVLLQLCVVGWFGLVVFCLVGLLFVSLVCVGC